MRNFACVLGVCAIAGSAFAQINYGNFTGANVRYLGVTESTGTGDPLPLFGAPVITQDALVFNPNFSSTSVGGTPDITDGQLSMVVESLGSQAITGFSITERGDFRFVGNGTAATTATVSLTLFVTILEINNAPVAPILLPVLNGTFGPSGGSYNLANNPTPGQNGLWFGGGMVDVAGYMAANNIAGSATSIRVVLDNTLTTTSEAGTIAFIRKKDFDGLSMTVIPAPGSAALVGMGAIAAFRRRR